MIHFGILGAGEIARRFLDAVRQTKDGDVIAVASRDSNRAKAWAEKEHLGVFYGSYDELLANPQIDVVYIATTTNAHYKNILQCLLAGKHVLCEKSMVCTYEQAKEVCALAKEKKLFLMEAMWSRFLPKTAAVRNWIAEGRIGRVNLMQATIGWKADITYNKRLFLPELGGGALYDIGIYPLELLPYFVNQKIVGLQPLMKRCDTGVDDISSLNLMLEGCFANIQCSLCHQFHRIERCNVRLISSCSSHPVYGLLYKVYIRHHDISLFVRIRVIRIIYRVQVSLIFYDLGYLHTAF